MTSVSCHTDSEAQYKLDRVATDAAKTGLNINIHKTEVMRVNNHQAASVQLHHEDIEVVDLFTYLGSVVSKDGGTDQDFQSRINKARFQHDQFGTPPPF